MYLNVFKKGVTFTRDLFEKVIRPTKIKLKISISGYTFPSEEIYTRTKGFDPTASKHNRNVFPELCTISEDNNFIIGTISP